MASEDAAAAVSSAAEADLFPEEATAEATAVVSAAQDVAMHPTKVIGCGGLSFPYWTIT